MKTFLYILTSLRDGRKDGVSVIGGRYNHHDQLLLVIEADDVEQAARAMSVNIIGSFDRSGVKCSTIHYTSDYYGGREHPLNHKEGYFFLSLKELEPRDEDKFPDLKEKICFKITAPK